MATGSVRESKGGQTPRQVCWHIATHRGVEGPLQQSKNTQKKCATRVPKLSKLDCTLGLTYRARCAHAVQTKTSTGLLPKYLKLTYIYIYIYKYKNHHISKAQIHFSIFESEQHSSNCGHDFIVIFWHGI